MKTNLLILIFFISIRSFSQKSNNNIFKDYKSVDLVIKEIKEKDTLKVIMLISDTSHIFLEYETFKTCKEVGCIDTSKFHLTYGTHSIRNQEDKGNEGSGICYWIYGYSINNYNNLICKYLDKNKIPLKEGIIVWMASFLK